MIWGQVVEGDEILSVKTGRWYTVSSTSTSAAGARIRLTGVAKMLTRPVAEEVPAGTHRRGATGAAVDLFIVAFSGPTVSERSGDE